MDKRPFSREGEGLDAQDDLIRDEQDNFMELPLFPLNIVLFPGMLQGLHIFEPRYREMMNRCIDEKIPFGLVLARQDREHPEAATHAIGTAARIARVERMDDGRMNLMVVGTQRFQIQEYKYTYSYLAADVRHYPVVNGATRLAQQLAQQMRPRIVEYVELLAKASNAQLDLNQLPEEPSRLAFLVAMALQINNEDKQKLLSLPGIPDILNLERYLLSRESLLLEYMANTQEEVEEMSSGPTGYIFPN